MTRRGDSVGALVMPSSLGRALLPVMALVVSAPAFGQTAVPPAQPFTAGWQDGFVLQTPNGDNRLVLGLNVQMDGRFSLDEPTPIVNTFTIRKARPTFSGRVAKYFDFKVMPDFGNGTTALMDAYFDIRFSPKFRVRTGKDKTPVGYELLMGDPYLLFPERTLASSLVPNRDVGVQAQGDLAAGKVSYSAGVFNGVLDGASSTTDVDTNNGKDVAARVVVQPFRSATPTSLSSLGFHLGGSTGKQIGALPAFRTSVGQTYFSYGAGVAADGRRNRLTPAAFYFYKALGAFAEYTRSAQTVTRAGRPTDVANHGWEGTVSVMLTGEAATDRIVRPKNSFAPEDGGWGALQLVARYSSITIDPDAFTNSLAAATASPDARSFAIGANWYPTAFIKYYMTYERTTFGRNLTLVRQAENVILFRTQLAF
jgi:phosphate-selective porin OprO/OprP